MFGFSPITLIILGVLLYSFYRFAIKKRKLKKNQHSWFLAGLLISPALWFPSVRKSLRSLLADKK